MKTDAEKQVIKKFFSTIVWFAFLSCVIIQGKCWIKNVSYIPINKVSFSGRLRYIDKKNLEAILADKLEQGLLRTNITAIQRLLLNLPWVQAAHVRRQWPDTLEIELLEQSPLAIWNGKGIVSENGEIFYPDNLEEKFIRKMPVFYGDETQVQEMVNTYFLIVNVLQPLNLSLDKLEIMPDQGWKAILNNSIAVILGQKELAKRLNRLVLAYNGRLVNEISQIEYIDLRYTNGLAIGWKSM